MSGNSSAALMKEYIDSDRVNFLVWRYLLEGNYRETAAKFQKEWGIQAPHRHFDFAPHVKHHALVSVLNRGFQFHALEREFAQSQVPQNNLPATAEEVPRGVFGPLIVQPPPQPASISAEAEAAAVAAPAASAADAAGEDDDAMGEDDDDVVPTVEEVEHSRKRQLPLANGSPPVKKPRLSNGYENGAPPDSATTPMEIDTHHNHHNHHAETDNNNHAYPSPLEVDQATTPLVRTFGPDQGTQCDKVDELAAETIFLSMATEDTTLVPAGGAGAADAAVPPSATPPTETAPVQTQHNPIVLHCEWNPRDPSVLAAAGTDALARVWTISRPTAPDPSPDHMGDHVGDSRATTANGIRPPSQPRQTKQPFENLVDDDATPNSMVSAMAWNSSGDALALATDCVNKARINIWGKDGTHLQRFDVGEPPIIKLKWNSNSSSILAVAPDNDSTLVTVLEAQSSNTVSLNLAHDLESNPLDATWISDSEFLLCGGRLLESYRCIGKEIVSNIKFETREDDSFSQVQFDPQSNLVATASESGVIDLWGQGEPRRSISAHSGAITSLVWQPLQTSSVEGERLLASGGEDGIVSIWNAKTAENKPKWSVTMDPPVVALAFTPDGAFLAGATPDKILIWKVGEYATPRASWSRTAHPGWLNTRVVNGGSNIEDTHCLCWDSTGQKLAYGTNSRVAVITFR